MIKLERTSVLNLENAMRGARNPMNSWDRTDSYYDENNNYILGENDLGLATKLAKAGPDHRKFIRQILVLRTERNRLTTSTTTVSIKLHTKKQVCKALVTQQECLQ